MSDFHKQTTHRCRTRRRCYCTGAEINPGDEYARFSGVCDGEFYSVAVHQAVAPIYDRHCKHACDNGDDGLPFGDLLESLLNFHDDQCKAERKIVAALPGVPDWFKETVEHPTK